MKKTLSLLMAAVCLLSLAVPAFAAGNIQYMSGVREEMCSADYWLQKAANPDRVLMTPAQIKAYNRIAAETESTNRVDLFSVERSYDATVLLQTLIQNAENDKPARDLFLAGKPLDKDALFGDLVSAMRSTGWAGSQLFRYAICTTHTGIYAIPSDLEIGYSETDPDSEFQLSELRVNEPFLIKQICTWNGKTFYWGMSDHLSGWVNAEHLAVCADRQTWKDAFVVPPSGKDFIVVTADSITTELSRTVPAISGVRLAIGTVLKLVEKEKIPRNIGERNAWNNYVVYLPTRNPDGTYQKEMAMIQEHCDVSVGYLPLTQRSLVETAFKCLGDRYGWAGTLGAMDCSLFTRAVYLCCGVNLPRNTNWQQNVPNTRFDLSEMTDAQKLRFLAKMPAGTLLYFPGHTMVFLGMENGMGYVISDTGSVSRPDGELQIESTYSVIVNPLSARRKNGLSWLSNLTAAVLPAEATGHMTQTEVKKATTKKDGKTTAVCTLCGTVTKTAVIPAAKSVRLKKTSYVYTGQKICPNVIVKDRTGKQIDPSNYTVKYRNNQKVGVATATVILHGHYQGKLETTFRIVPKATKIKSVQTGTEKLIVTWKKQTAQTSGYQIEYAKNKAFTKDRQSVKVMDPKATVAELTTKKAGAYYIRIRTVAKTKNGSYHSAWSEPLRVTVPR